MSRPIIPILISYLLGLIMGYYLAIPFHILIALLFISASLTTLFMLLRKMPIIFFAFSMLTLSILGIARMQAILNPSFPENHITNLIADEPLSLEGTISEPVDRRLDSTRLYINLLSLYSSNEAFSVTGKLLLTIGNTTPHLNPLPMRGEETLRVKYGDTIRFLARVKRPRNFHNPGGFDYERYLALKSIFATAFLKDAEGIIITAEGNSSFSAWIEEMREAIRDHVFKNAGDSAPIMLALTTGEQGEIPKETREAFSRAGTAHILAISGEHIGIIALASFALFLWLLKRSEWIMLHVNIYKGAAGLTIPAIILYSMIAGSGFSIVRAAIMGGTLLVALMVSRRKDIPTLIAFAAFLILVFEPQALFDISFQLSFASVISIAVIFPYLERAYHSKPEEILDKELSGQATNRLSSWLKVIFLVTLAATIGTAPIVAYYFNKVSLISPLSNMVIVPAVGFIVVPIGLVSSIFIPVFPYISGWLIYINSVVISLLIKLTNLFASLPLASFRVVTPTLLEITLFYFLIILFVYRKKTKRAKQLAVFAVVLLAAIESFYIFRPWLQKDLKITFLDVGQGESAFIEFPGGKRMLIDGGGMAAGDFDIGERVIAPFIWNKRVMGIDYIALSHPNSDHYNGLPFILRNFRIGEIWESGIEEGSEGYADFKAAAEESGGLHKRAWDGDRLAVNDVTVEVLNPPKGYEPRDDRGANNGSLVLKMVYGKTSFLFTGDIEKEAECQLLSKNDELKSTVLKAPHHGSLTSSTIEFLNAVKPEKAVFSVGYKNRFGFPKEDVIKRYKYINTDIYRTDRNGAIMAVSDGINARLFKTLGF